MRLGFFLWVRFRLVVLDMTLLIGVKQIKS